MSSDGDSNSGKVTLLVGLGAGVVLVGFIFVVAHFRDPTGWNDAWLDGQHLVVEEFREDEDSESERVVVLDLATGKRLESRDPSDSARAFALVNGKVWLAGIHQPGFEAWSAKSLETVVTREQLGLSYADSNYCCDGAFARVTQKDGRYGVVELATAKVVERDVKCSSTASRASSASSSGQSTRGWLGAPGEGSSQRATLRVGEQRFGGSETLLEPQFLFVDGLGLEVEGDFFVIHRIELGNNHAMKLSRVAADALEWTVPLGDPGTIERVLFSPPSTLAIVGHQGLTVLDVKRGNALWRAGK